MVAESTILGMEKKKFFFTAMSLFIILLFIGSGLVFLMGDFQNQDTQNPTDPNANQTPPTTFPFESATPVSAKVSQIFPVLLILGQTNNTRIDLIDAELFQKGAISVNSQYVGSESDGTLSYRAEIQLPASKNAADFLNTLRVDVNSLREVQGAVRGMIQLESINPIIMHNADLNLDQTLIPTDPFIPILLAETTQKDDLIQVVIRAQFAGSVSSNIEAYEVSNDSAQPEPKNISSTVSIDSIDPVLYLNGKVPSSLFPTQEIFESYLKNIPDSNQIESLLFASDSIITLSLDPIPSNNGFDYNTFLQSLSDWNHADVNQYKIEPINDSNGLTILFTLNDPQKTGSFMKTLTEQLKTWHLPEDTPIRETYFPYQIQVDLNSTNNTASFNAVSEWFNLRDFNATIQQPAHAFVSMLTLDQNNQLDVNQSVVIALNRAHNAGEVIEVEFMYQLVRGKLESIQGIEKE